MRPARMSVNHQVDGLALQQRRRPRRRWRPVPAMRVGWVSAMSPDRSAQTVAGGASSSTISTDSRAKSALHGGARRCGRPRAPEGAGRYLDAVGVRRPARCRGWLQGRRTASVARGCCRGHAIAGCWLRSRAAGCDLGMPPGAVRGNRNRARPTTRPMPWKTAFSTAAGAGRAAPARIGRGVALPGHLQALAQGAGPRAQVALARRARLVGDRDQLTSLSCHRGAEQVSQLFGASSAPRVGRTRAPRR